MPGDGPVLEAAAGPASHRLVELRAATSDRSTSPRSSSVEDEETGEVRETHRRPNLHPFADDPDCWLVASIEDYDLESNTAKPGPIFTERVIAPPPAPAITSAVDALAVVLNERGAVDPEHVAELLHGDVDAVIAELGEAIFRDPENGSWLTADAYLSGAVRSKLAAADAAAELDPAFARNVAALERVQPPDLRPSDITARLGAPWIPAADIIAFVKETMDADITIHHTAELACWTVNARQLSWTAAGTTEWGTHRRHAGELLSDALNSSIPQIFDTVKEGDSERRMLNTIETEAAKEKLAEDQERIPDLDLVRSGPHRPSGTALQRHLQQHRAPSLRRITSPTPGRLRRLSLYGHQKRAIWRIISSGSTYVAHAVGAGKTLSIAAAIMEQTSAWPDQQGHAGRAGPLPRAGRARVPGALPERPHPRRRRDEFREGEAPPLPVAGGDRAIGTRSSSPIRRSSSSPSRPPSSSRCCRASSRLMKSCSTRIDTQDRLSRKRVERMKEGHKERLEALASRKDDLLTISEIGIDQIIVDEAQEFRKLSFATNMTSLRGVDPNGSQRAWDLYVKSRYVDMKNPGRALVLASGTPITNTLGEMFTVQRLMAAALRERGLHEFDAWASTFGDTSTELELQPSGKYRPVTRFAQFVNVPELIAMFRSFADVVLPEDLRAL